VNGCRTGYGRDGAKVADGRGFGDVLESVGVKPDNCGGRARRLVQGPPRTGPIEPRMTAAPPQLTVCRWALGLAAMGS
jgi:hypothetical protein